MLVATREESRIHPVDIENSEVFRDLSPDLLSKVKAIARVESYPAGTVLFREDEPSHDLWLLRSGRVRLVFNAPGGWEYAEFLISQIKPGQAFGWTTLSGEEKTMAQAIAVDDCEVYLIPARELEEMMKSDLSFGYHVMQRSLRVVVKRLRDTRSQLRWVLANT